MGWRYPMVEGKVEIRIELNVLQILDGGDTLS